MASMTTPFTAVVFDFDGTLASLHIDFSDMRRRLAALAESFLPERPDPGPLPALEWLDELAREVAVHEGEDTAREFHTRGRFLVLTMEIEAAREGSLFEFTRPLLTRLRHRGLATAIITRNSTFPVSKVFPDWREHTALLLTREDVPRVKPHPAHLQAAMDALGAMPDRTLMVGDHFLDIETARAAGTRSGGVGTGRISPERLREAGADYVAEDADRLMDLLAGQGLI